MTLSAVINSNRKQIAELAIKDRLPTIRPGKQSEGKGNDERDWSEPHSGLLF